MTHLDRRRRLTPRAYLEDPWSFGRAGPVRWQLPADGNEVSLRVAQVQHRLVAAWAAERGASDARVLCDRFEMSKQVLSRVVLGQRWAGETLLAALVDTLDTRPDGNLGPAKPGAAAGSSGPPGEGVGTPRCGGRFPTDAVYPQSGAVAMVARTKTAGPSPAR